MAKEWNEYVKLADETTAKKKSEDLSVIESNRKKTIDATTDTYNTSISNINTSYADQYEKNAVQKYINEKQIAEKNANLGLKNSGLNRTQQTAVQLSYTNQREKIDLEKQNAINTLEKELASAVATINQESDNAKLNIEQYYTQLNNANAQNMYNTDATNESNERIAKAQLEKYSKINNENTYKVDNENMYKLKNIISSSTGTLSRQYFGTLKENGVDTVYNYNTDGTIKSVTYTDNITGMSRTFSAGVNPYTGRMHKDVRASDGSYDPNKAFDNGYQPNNINGEKLIATNATCYVYEHEQRVFELKSLGEFYLWRGDLGEYEKISDDDAYQLNLK